MRHFSLTGSDRQALNLVAVIAALALVALAALVFGFQEHVETGLPPSYGAGVNATMRDCAERNLYWTTAATPRPYINSTGMMMCMWANELLVITATPEN